MKKALITGIAGFAGSHLAQFLLSQKIRVFGFYHPAHATENLVQIKKNLNLFACDILKKKDLARHLKKINPDYVFHLAAFSSPPQSFQNPKKTLENNILGQLNLLETLALMKSLAKILVVGSADEYGKIDEKLLPANENIPLAPLSPYAVSKVAQDMLGYQFYLHQKLNIVRVRPFNHIGPGQSPNFVVSAFASQIVQLEIRGGGSIKVGNLESYRDFTDVRDMVKAYFVALEKGTLGEVYNIGSGKPVKIALILKLLLSLSSVKITVQKDRRRLRPGDIKIIYCDYSKFKKQTGWQPKIALEKTLSDTIEYERSQVNSNS